MTTENTRNKPLPNANLSKTTMFYDGGCPLCAREVAHYRRLDRNSRIHWYDIDIDATPLAASGVSKEDVMRRLHVIDSNRQLVTGIQAFRAIWKRATLLPRVSPPYLSAVDHQTSGNRLPKIRQPSLRKTHRMLPYIVQLALLHNAVIGRPTDYLHCCDTLRVSSNVVTSPTAMN